MCTGLGKGLLQSREDDNLLRVRLNSSIIFTVLNTSLRATVTDCDCIEYKTKSYCHIYVFLNKLTSAGVLWCHGGLDRGVPHFLRGCALQLLGHRAASVLHTVYYHPSIVLTKRPVISVSQHYVHYPHYNVN